MKFDKAFNGSAGGLITLKAAQEAAALFQEIFAEAQEAGLTREIAALPPMPGLPELIAMNRALPSPGFNDAARDTAQQRIGKHLAGMEQAITAINQSPGMPLAEKLDLASKARNAGFAAAIYQDRLGNLPENHEAFEAAAKPASSAPKI